MQYLAAQIRPAIDRALPVTEGVDAAITANVRLVRSRLAVEPTLATKVTADGLAVIGARYELTSQRVHRIH